MRVRRIVAEGKHVVAGFGNCNEFSPFGILKLLVSRGNFEVEGENQIANNPIIDCLIPGSYPAATGEQVYELVRIPQSQTRTAMLPARVLLFDL